MKNKLLSLLIVFILLITNNTFVQAKGVSARYIPCPLCSGVLVSTTDYSSWNLVYPAVTRTCGHGYNFGADEQKYRIETYTYDCLNCSYSTAYSQRGYDWICQGYN